MAEFTLEIAGHPAAVRSLFESTPHHFARYLTDRAPEFSIEVTQGDLRFEQEALLEEARQEGLRPRSFPDPFLERAAIQRKFAEFLIGRDILLLHGSTVAVDGRAYLFTAKCGTGKSTHTRLWRQVFGDRAVMVNDDKPFLQISPECVTAFGSPWSGKHGLDTNTAFPLKGICLLERGAENSIRRASPEELLPRLLRESFEPADPRNADRYRELVTALAETVPLWRMACTRDPHAAVISHSAMSQNI